MAHMALRWYRALPETGSRRRTCCARRGRTPCPTGCRRRDDPWTGLRLVPALGAGSLPSLHPELAGPRRRGRRPRGVVRRARRRPGAHAALLGPRAGRGSASAWSTNSQQAAPLMRARAAAASRRPRDGAADAGRRPRRAVPERHARARAGARPPRRSWPGLRGEVVRARSWRGPARPMAARPGRRRRRRPVGRRVAGRAPRPRRGRRGAAGDRGPDRARRARPTTTGSATARGARPARRSPRCWARTHGPRRRARAARCGPRRRARAEPGRRAAAARRDARGPAAARRRRPAAGRAARSVACRRAPRASCCWHAPHCSGDCRRRRGVGAGDHPDDAARGGDARAAARRGPRSATSRDRAEQQLLRAADVCAEHGMTTLLVDVPEPAARARPPYGVVPRARAAGRAWSRSRTGSAPRTTTPRPDVGARPRRVSLSRGDLQLLALLPQRRSNAHIAEQLGISVNTVKTRLRRLYAKLGAHDRDEAVARARARRPAPAGRDVARRRRRLSPPRGDRDLRDVADGPRAPGCVEPRGGQPCHRPLRRARPVEEAPDRIDVDAFLHQRRTDVALERRTRARRAPSVPLASMPRSGSRRVTPSHCSASRSATACPSWSRSATCAWRSRLRVPAAGGGDDGGATGHPARRAGSPCSCAVTRTSPTSASSPPRTGGWCSTSTTSTRRCRGPFEWDVKRLAASVAVARPRPRPVRQEGVARGSCRRRDLPHDHADPGSRLDPGHLVRAGWTSTTLVRRLGRTALSSGAVAARRRRVATAVTSRSPSSPRSSTGYAVSATAPAAGADRRGRPRGPSVASSPATSTPCRSTARRCSSRYSLRSAALRVVGVGSVGTRRSSCCSSPATANRLILQLKQAGPSVLERVPARRAGSAPRTAVASSRANACSRPPATRSWAGPTLDAASVDYFVRQLRDMKGSIATGLPRADALAVYGEVCGGVLARAHARAGDARSSPATSGARTSSTRPMPRSRSATPTSPRPTTQRWCASGRRRPSRRPPTHDAPIVPTPPVRRAPCARSSRSTPTPRTCGWQEGRAARLRTDATLLWLALAPDFAFVRQRSNFILGWEAAAAAGAARARRRVGGRRRRGGRAGAGVVDDAARPDDAGHADRPADERRALRRLPHRAGPAGADGACTCPADPDGRYYSVGDHGRALGERGPPGSEVDRARRGRRAAGPPGWVGRGARGHAGDRVADGVGLPAAPVPRAATTTATSTASARGGAASPCDRSTASWSTSPHDDLVHPDIATLDDPWAYFAIGLDASRRATRFPPCSRGCSTTVDVERDRRGSAR